MQEVSGQVISLQILSKGRLTKLREVRYQVSTLELGSLRR